MKARHYALFVKIGEKRYYRLSRTSYLLTAARRFYQDALLFGSMNGFNMSLRPVTVTHDEHAPGTLALAQMVGPC